MIQSASDIVTINMVVTTMHFALVFLLFFASQVCSKEKVREPTIEEYKVLMENVNNTLVRMYKSMEMLPQRDMDNLEAALAEAMTELKLKPKEKSVSRKKRESSTLEKTLDFVKENLESVINDINDSDTMKTLENAQVEAKTSFEKIYSYIDMFKPRNQK